MVRSFGGCFGSALRPRVSLCPVWLRRVHHGGVLRAPCLVSPPASDGAHPFPPFLTRTNDGNEHEMKMDEPRRALNHNTGLVHKNRAARKKT